MISSRALADVAADAIGISRESAQLHLKTIRAEGQISFKGYGRGAAAMTPLDASRLVLAIVGSTFAKDSMDVLERFARLKPIRDNGDETLEVALSTRIAELPIEELSRDAAKNRLVHARPFGSRQLAETALQLLSPIAPKSVMSTYAVLRWVTAKGHSQVRVFGSDSTSRGMERERGSDLDATSLIDAYTDHRFFQIRALRRAALVDIAKALKGLGNSSGNFGNK